MLWEICGYPWRITKPMTPCLKIDQSSPTIALNAAATWLLRPPRGTGFASLASASERSLEVELLVIRRSDWNSCSRCRRSRRFDASWPELPVLFGHDSNGTTGLVLTRPRRIEWSRLWLDVEVYRYLEWLSEGHRRVCSMLHVFNRIREFQKRCCC